MLPGRRYRLCLTHAWCWVRVPPFEWVECGTAFENCPARPVLYAGVGSCWFAGDPTLKRFAYPTAVTITAFTAVPEDLKDPSGSASMLVMR